MEGNEREAKTTVATANDNTPSSKEGQEGTFEQHNEAHLPTRAENGESILRKAGSEEKLSQDHSAQHEVSDSQLDTSGQERKQNPSTLFSQQESITTQGGAEVLSGDELDVDNTELQEVDKPVRPPDEMIVQPVQPEQENEEYSMATSESESEDKTYYTRKIHGKGHCLILVNYLHDDLPGYRVDKENITKFFKEKDFDVDCFEDLTLQELRSTVQMTKVKLDKPSTHCDRLFVFVLSHGKEKGILCRSQSKHAPEANNTKSISVKPDRIVSEQEIINSFTHDKVKSMKHYPKCFFFQICRGSNPSRAAANKDQDIAKSEQISQNTKLVVVQADVLVAHPTLFTNQSFVNDNKGSLFIRFLLNEMKRNKNEHLLEILTRVTQRLSALDPRGKTFYYCNAENHQILIEHNQRLTPLKIFAEYERHGEDGKVVRGEIDYWEQHIKMRQKIPKTCSLHCNIRNNGREVCKDCVFETTKDLDSFAHEAFEISGTLYLNNKTVKGSVYHMKNGWYIDSGSVRFAEINEEKPFKVFGVLEDDVEYVELEEDKLLGEQVYLATPDGLICEEGILLRQRLPCKIYSSTFRDSLYGMKATPRQLPVFTSLLTKKLYLGEPPNIEKPCEVCKIRSANKRESKHPVHKTLANIRMSLRSLKQTAKCLKRDRSAKPAGSPVDETDINPDDIHHDVRYLEEQFKKMEGYF